MPYEEVVMNKLISALEKVIAFKSDSLSILKSMIDDHVGSYDYLMSDAGNDDWDFYQSEDGELNRHEWAKDEDEFNSQMGNPAHFFYNTKELKSSWLVHFTDASPLSILKEGFKGRDYFGIGLTTQFKKDANPGDLAFAYPINKIKEMFRYGNNAVVLKVPECLEAYHIGDEEDQIIFDVNKVTKMFGLMYKKGTDEFAVINKNGKEVKRFLATKANLKKLAVGCAKKLDPKIIKGNKTINDLELKLFSWGDVEKPISEDEAKSAFTIRAYKDGKEVGYAQVYSEDAWYVYEVAVKQAYRRQGIATLLYDYAEEVTGRTVYPQVLDGNINDPEISDDAFLFWKKRNPSLVKDILNAVTDDNRKDLIKLV
jgi:ribosomal protein S18 acetylase RimI-like enzyme